MHTGLLKPAPFPRNQHGIGLCECLVCLLLFSLLALNITRLRNNSLQSFSIMMNHLTAARLAAELGQQELRSSSEITRLSERTAALLPAGKLRLLPSGDDLHIRIVWTEPGTNSDSQYELMVRDR